MKRTFAIILVLGLIAVLSSCSDKDDTAGDAIAGKTFVWEKEGFGGDFTITLKEDGTYEYYAGFLSSYIGSGDWTTEDDVVILTENSGYDNVFRFAVKDGDLIYLSDGSSEFMYVTVEDGDRFLPIDADSS